MANNFENKAEFLFDKRSLFQLGTKNNVKVRAKIQFLEFEQMFLTNSEYFS